MRTPYQRPKSKEQRIARRLERYPEALALVEGGKAPETTVRAVALIQRGLNGREIAREMGVGRSTAYAYLNDPLGTEATKRKMKAARPCVDCGALCNTDGSVSKPTERCLKCARAKASAAARWKPEAILAAINSWAEVHGEPPRASDWNSGLRGHPAYQSGEWPAWNTVAGKFGSFNAAVRAAGFKPHMEHGGQPRKPLTTEQLAETAALVDEMGLEGAAEHLGMKVSGVKRRLKQHRKQPTGGSKVPRALTAEEIIDRELEKHLTKADRLRLELKDCETQADRLKLARAALNGAPASLAQAA